MHKISVTNSPTEWGFSKVFVKKDAQAIEAGIFTCEACSSLPLHTHEAGDEYCYLFEGTGVFVINEKETVVETGELIKIPKGVEHRSYALDKPFSSFYLVCP